MGERALELKVGAVLLVALVVLCGFIFLLGDISFEKGIRLNVDYAFSGAIQPAAPVKVSGVKVGRVEEIRFLGGHAAAPAEDALQVRLVLSIEERARPVLTEGARFYINTQGLLGEHYVEVVPAREPGPALADGAAVRGVDPPRFDSLFQRVYDFLGVLSKLLAENGDVVEDLVRSAAALAKTVDGTLKQNEDALGATIRNAAVATQEAAGLLAALGRVVGDGRKLEQTLGDAGATVTLLKTELPDALVKVKAALDAVQKVTALVDGVPKDEVKNLLGQTRSALTKADTVLEDAQVVSRRIRSGTGTLGLLLSDDEIYDDLKDLLRDLKQHPWKLVWKD